LYAGLVVSKAETCMPGRWFPKVCFYHIGPMISETCVYAVPSSQEGSQEGSQEDSQEARRPEGRPEGSPEGRPEGRPRRDETH